MPAPTTVLTFGSVHDGRTQIPVIRRRGYRHAVRVGGRHERDRWCTRTEPRQRHVVGPMPPEDAGIDVRTIFGHPDPDRGRKASGLDAPVAAGVKRILHGCLIEQEVPLAVQAPHLRSHRQLQARQDLDAHERIEHYRRRPVPSFREDVLHANDGVERHAPRSGGLCSDRTRKRHHEHDARDQGGTDAQRARHDSPVTPPRYAAAPHPRRGGGKARASRRSSDAPRPARRPVASQPADLPPGGW
jgi:hypothetical protein